MPYCNVWWRRHQTKTFLVAPPIRERSSVLYSLAAAATQPLTGPR
jgi:hypothetical protein